MQISEVKRLKKNLIFPIKQRALNRKMGNLEGMLWQFEALCTCPFDLQRSIASIYSLLIIMIITINHHHLELTRLCRNMVVVE